MRNIREILTSHGPSQNPPLCKQTKAVSCAGMAQNGDRLPIRQIWRDANNVRPFTVLESLTLPAKRLRITLRVSELVAVVAEIFHRRARGIGDVHKNILRTRRYFQCDRNLVREPLINGPRTDVEHQTSGKPEARFGVPKPPNRECPVQTHSISL